jgi:hypothetical protein
MFYAVILFQLVLRPALLLAQTSTSSASVGCEGENRCRTKLIKTLDQLAHCQERRAEEPPPQLALGNRGTQDSPIVIEYKTPTWVWVTLGVSLAASVVLGVYQVVQINDAADDARRALR